MPRPDARSRGGGRTIGLGLLAVLAALLIAYLGRCLPGLGTGSAPGTPGPEAATPEERPAQEAERPAEAAAEATSFTVRGDTCAAGEAKAVPCETVCASLPGEHDTAAPVVVNAAHGTHAAVERLRECLEGAGFSKVTVRTE